MRIRLPAYSRSVFTFLGAAAAGAVVAGGIPQIASAWDRPACTETVMRAVSSASPVAGSYSCFDASLQMGLQTIGVSSDQTFATQIGQNGHYRFVQKTRDGGYVYEYDRELQPHDEMAGAVIALGLPKTSLDLRNGDLAAAWNERHDFGAAWAEITGQTQRDHSQMYTFYIDGDGKVSAVK